MALQTFCSPYISRTIKGWKIRVRICFTVEDTVYTASLYATQTGAIATELTALTNSTWVAGSGWSHNIEQAWATSTSDYDNAEDAVVLSYATNLGTIAKISIPNPKDSIFLADKMTVDPTNTAVMGLNTYLVLAGDPTTEFVASTAAGGLYQTFLGGLRKRSKTRRKLNIWVRNPELNAPGI